MKVIDLFLLNIETHGKKTEIIKAIEEMAELILELCKYVNGDCSRYHNIAEEMADVEIMLAQLRLIFQNKAEINAQKVYKLNRLKKDLVKPSAEGSE